jgi:hypothetical protein
LQLKKGNDERIKKYLAGKVKEFKDTIDGLKNDLSKIKTSLKYIGVADCRQNEMI